MLQNLRNRPRRIPTEFRIYAVLRNEAKQIESASISQREIADRFDMCCVWKEIHKG